MDLFYSSVDLGGLTVFDPFMGSGTTVGEAVRLGCTVIGRDINPVAYNMVRAGFATITVDEAKRTFRQLEQTVGRQVRRLYQLPDGAEVLYFFWVKQIACPSCGSPIDLFKRYVFAQHAYPQRRPDAQCLCPRCSGVFPCRYDSTEAVCPLCSNRFNPQLGPANRARASCLSCGMECDILKAVKASGGPPPERMYAKLVLRHDGRKEYRPISAEDLEAYAAAARELDEHGSLVADMPIEPGHNTNQARSYGYCRWSQFFNSRQLLALSWLGEAIRDVANEEARLAFGILFSGTTEFNNMFCSFKGEGTGAVRHMFSHHILKPERQPLEANVWGTPKSSGSFSTLFRSRLLRALEYRDAPFEVEVKSRGGRLETVKRMGCSAPVPRTPHLAISTAELSQRSVYLSCGDSAETDIPDLSVDLVVTDPPFFDNVHYSELADFFYAWQLPVLGAIGNQHRTTRDAREVQDRDAISFSTKLAGVLSECRRVLRDEGLLVFTYHHSREDGWRSVAHAIASAGFSLVAAQPVKAEMSVAVPKHQAKEPIDLDVVMVCRKATHDLRPLTTLQAATERAQHRAQEKAEAFWQSERRLSASDLRVIMLSHLLIELSPGRTADELVSAFDAATAVAQEGVAHLQALQEGRRSSRPEPAESQPSGCDSVHRTERLKQGVLLQD